YGGQPAPVYGGPGASGGGEPRAILYSGNGMSGRTFEIDRDVVRNLERVGFNDRASSLTVLNGYWIFCSDANFEGDCRTFGPGDYPNLPFDLDRKISSGRRIADRYPYEGRPTWSR
ncbi:MAG TPA: beta/gamma crystallin-related protein, partial [Casimicrobiaceae bacterium]|nr:beta/gamma crystallin-related protein [Casimicrobiaceae bacterium]